MVRLVRAGAALLALGAIAAPVSAHASSTEARLKYTVAPGTTDGIYVKTAARLKYTVAPGTTDGIYVKTAAADRGIYVKTVIPADGIYIKTV